MLTVPVAVMRCSRTRAHPSGETGCSLIAVGAADRYVLRRDAHDGDAAGVVVGARAVQTIVSGTKPGNGVLVTPPTAMSSSVHSEAVAGPG